MTYIISMLKNIFPLHTKNTGLSSNVSQYATLCHNVDICSLSKLLMLTNAIILPISGCDHFPIQEQQHAGIAGHACSQKQ